MRREMLRYAAVGVLNSTVGLGLIFVGLALLGMRDTTANLFGYAAGWILSYTVNKAWTFNHRGATMRSLGRFITISAIAYVVNLAMVLLLHRRFGINVYIAQAVGVATYTTFAFLGSYYYAFPKIERRPLGKIDRAS
jgi:putative flippase GtrA